MFAARGQVATEHVCGCRFWSMILRREQLRRSRTHTHRKVEVTVFRRMCLSSSRVCSLGFGRWWWGHARGEYEDRFSSWGDRKRFDVDACSFDEYAASLSRVQTQNCAETTLCRWLLLVEMISSLCYNVRFCLSSLCVEVQRPHPHWRSHLPLSLTGSMLRKTSRSDCKAMKCKYRW